MERAPGGRVAVRVRDALEALAKGGLTGVRHFRTLIQNGGTWLVTLRADGSCGRSRDFTLRATCTVREERGLRPEVVLFRATALVVTVTRSSDAQSRAIEYDIHLDPRNGAFWIDAADLRARFDEALQGLGLRSNDEVFRQE